MGRKPHRSRSVNLIFGLAKMGILMSFAFTLSYLVVKAYDYGSSVSLSTFYTKTLPYSEMALNFLNTTPLGHLEPEVASLQDKRPDATLKRGVLRVALLADSHDDFDNLQLALKKSVAYQADLAIFLGDYTSVGVKEGLQQAKELMDTSAIPYHSLPGDHDLWKSGGLTNFVSIFGTINHFEDVNGYRFIIFNNSDTQAGVSESDIQWLEDTLGASTGPSLIFMSNPLYNTNSFKLMGENEEVVLAQAQRLLKLIRLYDVRGVFAGDNHLSSVSADPEKATLTHYVIGALTNDRNLQSPRFSILDIYDPNSFKVTEIVLNPER